MARDAALPIAVRHLTKSYGTLRVLDAVDLDVQRGEFLTLLGPSGSGKTTLLMMLAGFVRPDCGSITFGEREVIRLPPHKRDVGMVFQNYALFPHLDVTANIAFPLRLRGIGKAETKQRVEQALELVKLDGYGARRIDQLSGGQRQRIALARAIVFEPRILLMDEPLSALDKQLREHMQIELRQLHERLGMTTVYVTHDQREALTMSDRIAVIDLGRIRQIDTPKAIYERPANRFVAEFIGESTFVTVNVDSRGCSFNGIPLTLASQPARKGPHHLMIRPERLTILEHAATEGVNLLPATVTAAIYQGDSVLVHASLTDGSNVSVRASASARAPLVGENLNLGLKAVDTYLLPADESAA
ncbi:MAG: ABC transporter ATP-binding protein [Methylobacterium sp.]|nr:ABC transporter ATP-binding protein [Methylobacterium sp.]MCA3602330.1 ABC transporter ATP-binding protein [Methylobacterium sp.]MCA3613952.1 ABC transporter ATP-binding protein [Methylobacterium sp.]MCA3619452.1 ABC transporter ATP-binding protein [Methylobacterium sp.]MCA3622387.1 ABC transporter ATP-binding protein [Methylobacterium sp.]